MVRNLDTAVLRTFLGVADAASMTSAAAALNLTQAAVSQQIKRLEESFGAQLFERDRRGMKLTHAGERLFGKARKFVALNDEIFSDMTAPTEECEVRFGGPYALVNTALAVMPLMRSTVPPSLHVLGPNAGLPPLPAYSVCLHLRKAGSSRVADALADYIRTGLSRSKAA